jgi:2,3-diaminopropionate biosynthesis protein SbnB
MNQTGMVIVGGQEVRDLLAGRDAEVLAAVRQAYVAHGMAGQSSLPHSTFLRFPGDDLNRIIALPAFLGDSFQVAGVKWIASFPGNVKSGLPRASAVLILNSTKTGLPEAILEASLISAARTAASAAGAAAALLGGQPPARVGLIGTGPINREVARFLRTALPGTSKYLLYDLDADRAASAAAALVAAAPGVEAEVASGIDEVLRGCPLVSFATTAVQPHVGDLSICPPGAVILHVSLRDLTPQAILAADNVVDDPDHACRAQTSIHLAEQLTGSRAHIRCTIAEIYQGKAAPRRDARSIAIFSPFGLGILDLAVGKLVRDLALAGGKSTLLHNFQPLPEPPAVS